MLCLSLSVGNINLSNVNLRPDKINQLMQSLAIPFSLRAGTIGKLDLKVSSTHNLILSVSQIYVGVTHLII